VHNRGISDYDSSALRPLSDRAAADNPALAQDLSMFDKRVSFTGLGAVYDPGNYLLQAEYTWIRWELGARSMVPQSDAYYGLAGWRFGTLMPYGIYAKRKSGDALTVSGFNDPALNASMSAIAKRRTNAQHSISLGMRWDFRANMALKLQWDRITVDSPDGASYLVNLNPLDSPKQGQQFHVLGLNLDFVF
jgi:predicted porin